MPYELRYTKLVSSSWRMGYEGSFWGEIVKSASGDRGRKQSRIGRHTRHAVLIMTNHHATVFLIRYIDYNMSRLGQSRAP